MSGKQIAPESLVERVKRLAEKATGGEWTSRKSLHPSDGGYNYAIGAQMNGREHCIAECFEIVDRGPTRVDAHDNAAFIAAARTDAPRLCDLVEELATALEGVIAVSDRATVEYDRARAALEKVKAS